MLTLFADLKNLISNEISNTCVQKISEVGR